MIGVEPTPQNAAQIAYGIMSGKPLVRSLCDAIADDEPSGGESESSPEFIEWLRSR